MRLAIYDDDRALDLAPLTLTRPAFDLLCGAGPLMAKHRRHFAPGAAGFLVRPWLAAAVRDRYPHAPVNDPTWLAAGPTVLVNGRWLPPSRPADALTSTVRSLFAEGSFIALCGSEIAFVALTQDRLAEFSVEDLENKLDEWTTVLPRKEVGGRVVTRPWDLLDANGSQITADFPAVADPDGIASHPPGVAFVGPTDRFFLDPSAIIDPMVVIDTTGGPVIVAAGAIVTAFSRLAGPCYIGPGTHILGATIKPGCSFGPHCRIGGVVEATIVQGFSNKAHDGFLGHSYLGEWVNLAAGTVVSDLRIDYADVTVPTEAGVVSTGRLKFGAVFGDHAKTGIGALLNCGTVAGVFAHLLPTGKILPREVPSFTRVGAEGPLEDLNFDALFAAADRMMRRRGRGMTSATEATFRAVASQTAAARRRVIGGEAPLRILRVA